MVVNAGAQQANGWVTQNGRQIALQAESLNLKPGDKIQLTTVGGAKNLLTGRFTRLTDSALVINYSGTEVAIRFDDIAILEVPPQLQESRDIWPTVLKVVVGIGGSLVAARLLYGRW
jgi:hypothetical protein